MLPKMPDVPNADNIFAELDNGGDTVIQMALDDWLQQPMINSPATEHPLRWWTAKAGNKFA